jgi:hypothetical protein
VTRDGHKQLQTETRDLERHVGDHQPLPRGEAGGFVMRILKRFAARLCNSVMPRRDDQRLKEEIEEHIALQTAEHIRAGLPPAEARRQALLKFGGVATMKEDNE